MATGLTELILCNQMLDILSQAGNATQDHLDNDTTVVARWFNRNKDVTRREMLRANIWTFSKVLDELAEDGTAPDFDYAHRYAIPGTYIRLLPVTVAGKRNGALVDYEIFSGFIHCNEETPLKVRAIEDVADPDDWDDLFGAAYVGSLAKKYALRLTGKTNYRKIAEEYFDSMFAQAVVTGAVEEYQEPIEAHDIIRVRD